MKRLFLVMLVVFSLGSQVNANLIPVNESLNRIETEHFIYIYQESLEVIIADVAKDFEDAYAVITPMVGWAPDCKIRVMVTDSMDAHNGWASPIPRPTAS